MVPAAMSDYGVSLIFDSDGEISNPNGVEFEYSGKIAYN